MRDRNMFGGGNPNSLYTPMSEDEQEALSRLVESGDIHIHIVGWGWVHSPKITFGDLRVAIPIQITFNRPVVPIPVTSFTLELRTGAGQLLFRKEYDVSYGGLPIFVGTGFTLSMIWDIAIHSMDPRLVKALKPGATGLTSRWIDKDTGAPTLLGNTAMSAQERTVLTKLRKGEAEVRANDVRKLARAKKNTGG